MRAMTPVMGRRDTRRQGAGAKDKNEGYLKNGTLGMAQLVRL